MTLVPMSSAMAYKTKRVCTKTEATLKEPAKKSCKRFLVPDEAKKEKKP
jgi:hypothetical protein